MNKKVICTTCCLASCLIVIMFAGMSHAGPNASAACRLDMNFDTVEIESDITASANEMIIIAVVAEDVSNLDTYQAEVRYDPSHLRFVGGYEEVPMRGVRNLLKGSGGSTLGFQAVEREPGVVNIANTLTGTDTSEAPEGSGILSLLRFRMLKAGPARLGLANVHFVDSLQNEDLITDMTDGNVN